MNFLETSLLTSVLENSLPLLLHTILWQIPMYYRKIREYKVLSEVDIQADDTLDEVNKLIKEVYESLM